MSEREECMRVELFDDDKDRIENVRRYLSKNRPSNLEGVQLTDEIIIRYSIHTTSDLVEAVKLVDKLGKERDKKYHGKDEEGR